MKPIWAISRVAWPLRLPERQMATIGAAAAGTTNTPLEAELREIVAALPGRYAGPASGGTIYHKIVRIDAPQFGGDTVFYHQISRDGFDSTAPTQQKIYVFDRSPQRAFNVMRSYVFLPKQGYANFEQDAAALKSVQPGMLIKVLGPSGNFTPLPRAGQRRHLVLLGGGSGITPLMSIAETVLQIGRAHV